MNTKLKQAITLAVSIYAFSATGIAQSPKVSNPSANAQGQSSLFNGGAILGTMYDGIFEYFADPKTAMKLAKIQKNYYDALVKEGFSDEQALQIVCSTGLPTLGSK